MFVDESILDSFDLSGYHREHRNINSIELVKATPSSTLTQSREDLTNSLPAQHSTGDVSNITVGRVLIAQFNKCVLAKSGQIANPIITMDDPVPYCSVRARLCLRIY